MLWQTYLLYHPDLRASGIAEEQQAKEHYIKQVGRMLLQPSCGMPPQCCALSLPGAEPSALTHLSVIVPSVCREMFRGLKRLCCRRAERRVASTSG